MAKKTKITVKRVPLKKPPKVVAKKKRGITRLGGKALAKVRADLPVGSQVIPFFQRKTETLLAEKRDSILALIKKNIEEVFGVAFVTIAQEGYTQFLVTEYGISSSYVVRPVAKRWKEDISKMGLYIYGNVGDKHAQEPRPLRNRSRVVPDNERKRVTSSFNRERMRISGLQREFKELDYKAPIYKMNMLKRWYEEEGERKAATRAKVGRFRGRGGRLRESGDSRFSGNTRDFKKALYREHLNYLLERYYSEKGYSNPRTAAERHKHQTSTAKKTDALELPYNRPVGKMFEDPDRQSDYSKWRRTNDDAIALAKTARNTTELRRLIRQKPISRASVITFRRVPSVTVHPSRPKHILRGIMANLAPPRRSSPRGGDSLHMVSVSDLVDKKSLKKRLDRIALIIAGAVRRKLEETWPTSQRRSRPEWPYRKRQIERLIGLEKAEGYRHTRTLKELPKLFGIALQGNPSKESS